MKQSTSFAQVATNQFDYLSSALCANTPPCKKHSSSRKYLTLSISLRLLLVLFLTLTASTAWGTTATYTLNSSNNGGSVTTGNVSWSIASGAITAQNNNCKLTGTITVTLPAGATLNKVSIAKSNTWGSGATVTFKTGSTTLNTFSNSGDYTLTTNKDKLTYTFSKSGTSSKNAWVKSITVDYIVAAATTYAVTYDLNGGTGTKPTQANVAAGGTFKLAASSGFSNVGYSFAGWNDGTKTYNAGDIYTMPAKAVTLKAQWTALPKYTVTWNVNGEVYATQVTEGSKPTFPDTPESCDATSNTFYGWATATWDGKINDVSAKTIYTSANDMPAVNGAVSYYAVFAKKETSCSGTAGWSKVTSTSDLEVGATYAISSAETAGNYLSTYTGANNFPNSTTTICKLVLGGSADAWTFKINDASSYNNYYLTATSTTSSNYLKATSTIDNYCKFSISFANTGNAVITCTGKQSRNILRYNSTNNPPIFACYSSGQSAVYLQKYSTGSTTTYSDYITTCAAGDPCASLQAPNVTATATANSITLSWAAVSGATSYNIYNYTTEETDETTNLTYTFNGLDPNTEYEWEVEAVSTTCNGKGKKGTTTTLNACEQLGVATDLTVETDYVHTDGKTYVKFNWTPADNTKNNAASQKLCFGKVGEAGTCVDDLANNITWTGDEVSKLEPGTYWWSIQALGDGVKYCDGDAKEGTNFTIIAYNIIIDSNIQYGKVTTDLTQAVVDKTVTLTATPDKGYQFSSWIVTKDGGGTVEVTNNKFTMPASNVTVSATFEALPKLTTPTNLSVSDISCSGATLAWSAVAGASKYELRLTNTSTSNTTTSYPTTNSAYLTLAAGTTYSWTVQAIGDGLTYNSSEVATGEDFTLHYTITYNENGGSIVEDDCGTTLPSELPTTTKSHYTFIGWYMDKELNTPATAGAKLTQNTTLYAKWEEIKFTITWSINENTTNSQELQEGTTITPPADLEAATYACEDKVFVGWVGASIDGSTNEEPDFITDFGNVKENKTYYAVFATPSGDGFTLGQSGDFTIYANVDGTNYYATGTIGATNNGKIVGTTEEGDANVYTFTAISGNNESYTYNIKQGDDYIKFVKKSNGDATTDLATTDTEYTWTISPGAKGTWRVAAEMAGRAIIFRSDSKLFGGYATSNFTQNQSTYYDIEIGGATTYTEYVTSCVTCEKVLTISKGDEENGTFTLDKDGEQETCDGLSVLVTPTHAEHYHVASVTASTGETAVNNGDGTYTITYIANSTGESTINVVFEEDTKYTVTWMVNGLPYTIGAPSTTVYADERVATLPTPPEPNAYCGDVFVGWTTENPASGNFNEAPTVYNEQSAFPIATGDQTFYAVFADDKN